MQGLRALNERAASLPVVLPSAKHLLLTALLREVSRSFYLTLRVLPAGMREPVSLAYLLARSADSIADTPLIATTQRPRLLQALRSATLGGTPGPDLSALAVSDTDPAHAGERRLLRQLPKLLSLLAAQSDSDRGRIGRVVASLIDGMLQDMQRFTGGATAQVSALRDAQELEAYCYQVAGCVGEFWTQIAIHHVRSLRNWPAEDMARLGVDFGKALQLTNILRDLRQDLQIGRCYLPLDELQGAGLDPEQLLHADRCQALQPVLTRWLARNHELYDSAERYFLAIPRRCLRLRLAALWPVLIGLRTLRQLQAQQGRWLLLEKKTKVRRRWIYSMLALSLIAVLSNRLSRRWIAGYRRAAAVTDT